MECAICHKRKNRLFSVDHIVPMFLGGRDTATNRRLAHVSCNNHRQHFMTLRELLWALTVHPFEIYKPVHVKYTLQQLIWMAQELTVPTLPNRHGRLKWKALNTRY